MENPYRKISNINPQRDNGHRRINSDVLQALIAAPLSGIEFRIALCVIDKTWGYDKKEALISYAQYRDATLLSRPSIGKALLRLIDRHIVLVEKVGGRSPNLYLFNKHYDTWIVDNTVLTSKHRVNNSSKHRVNNSSKHPEPSTEATTENKNIYKKQKDENSFFYRDGKKFYQPLDGSRAWEVTN